jgi:uncharacterized protein (TIGR03067 family)
MNGWRCAMILGHITAVTVALLFSINEAKIQKEMEKLAGTWIATRQDHKVDTRRINIKPGTISVIHFSEGDVSLVIEKSGAMTCHLKFGSSRLKGESLAGTITLDPAKKPKAYKVIWKDGKVAPEGSGWGIYELEGDTLKLCYLRDRTKRPSKFSTEGEGDTLMTYKRKKPKKDQGAK